MVGDETHKQEHRHRAHRPGRHEAVGRVHHDAEGGIDPDEHGDPAEAHRNERERHRHPPDEEKHKDRDAPETDGDVHASGSGCWALAGIDGEFHSLQQAHGGSKHKAQRRQEKRMPDRHLVVGELDKGADAGNAEARFSSWPRQARRRSAPRRARRGCQTPAARGARAPTPGARPKSCRSAFRARRAAGKRR